MIVCILCYVDYGVDYIVCFNLGQILSIWRRTLSHEFTCGSAGYVKQALHHIPKEGNPVWIFPTTRTDFTLINKDLNTIVERLSTVATLPRDSSAYSQALNDIRERLSVIVDNVSEATP